MKKKTVIKIEIDPSCRDPEVIIRADKESATVQSIVTAVENCLVQQPLITVYRGDQRRLLSQRDIQHIYTESRRVIICTDSGKYESHETLRKIEDILDEQRFVRISRFEIINIEKVSSFDFSNGGTVKITFSDGTSTWVARRYVHAIEIRLSQQQS